MRSIFRYGFDRHGFTAPAPYRRAEYKGSDRSRLRWWWLPPAAREAARSGCLGFRHVGGNRIHQRRRQAVVGIKPEFFQTRPDPVHLGRLDAGFDHRRYERGKSGRGPSAFLEQFGMDEVEAVERMRLVLDTAVHMGAADCAG